MRKRDYRLIVLSALLLGALPVMSQDRNIESASQRRATAAALDPELTNYQYPHPVRFFEADTQVQKLRMAYMDVAAAKPTTRSASSGSRTSGTRWAGCWPRG